MSRPPANPKIYHITHMDNLASIVSSGQLLSDATIAVKGGPKSKIGMSEIKRRRLRLPVSCHRGDYVGDYVPFYFCPRSIMLFVIRCANHPDLDYRGGQDPILHLEADVRKVVAWADRAGIRWAFSPSNASALYTQFHSDLAALKSIDWKAVVAADFRSPETKEAKQAEFLVYGSFPWILIDRIGVISLGMKHQVDQILSGIAQKPVVVVRREWYF
jgi:hypothetical protein